MEYNIILLDVEEDKIVKNAAFCLNETNYLTKFDKFTVVLSSLVHDIGHSGVNNAFLVLVQSNHAIKCNY